MKTHQFRLLLLLSLLFLSFWVNAQKWLKKQPILSATDKQLYEEYRIKINHFYINDKDSAEYYINKALRLVAKYPNSKQQANIYAFYGIFLANEYNYKYFDKAIKIIKIYPDKSLEFSIEKRKANMYHNMGDEIRAFKMYHALLQKIQQGSYGLEDQMDFYQAFSNFYLQIDDEKAAVEFLHKGLKITKLANDNRRMATFYLQLANYYNVLPQLDSCIQYANQGIEAAKKAKSIQRLATLYALKGAALLEQDKPQEAYPLIKEALDIAEESKFHVEINSAKSALGNYYIKVKNYPLAEKYFVELEQNKNISNIRSFVLESLTTLYKETRQYDKALVYLEKRLDLQKKEGSIKYDIASVIKNEQEHQKKLLETQKNLEIAQQENQYKLLEKTHENALLEKQILEKNNINQANKIIINEANIKAKQLELDKKNQALLFAEYKQYLLLSFWILTGIFVLYIFQSYRKEKRLRKIIESQSLALEELNHTKDKIFSMLGHDLRSPVSALKHTLSVWKNLSADKQQHLIENLYGKVDNIQLILENLMQWSVMQLDKQVTQPIPVELDKLVMQMIRQVEDIAQQKDVYLIDNLQPVQIMTDEQQLMIVIRNILHNAIKFTPPHGAVSISSQLKENQAVVCIKDTGIGMEVGQLSEVFKKVIPQYGTAGEKGMGLGLEVCRELMQHLHGQMLFESQLNKGTTVTLTFEIIEEKNKVINQTSSIQVYD